MPILDVDKAHTVMVIKRSMNPGFAGIDNELYYMDKTLMLFGDAKAFVIGDPQGTAGEGGGVAPPPFKWQRRRSCHRCLVQDSTGANIHRSSVHWHSADDPVGSAKGRGAQ